MLEYNHGIKRLAQKLRNNSTPWERRLWFTFLRNYRPRFTRQKTLGNYIVDFYCAKAKLVIELDGSGHYTDEQKKYDVQRTQYLESLGLKVVRFTNLEEDKQFYQVCATIDEYVKSHCVMTKPHR